MQNITFDEFGNTLVLSDLLHHPTARIFTDRLHVLGVHKFCGGQMQSQPISDSHVVLTCNGGCHFHAHAPRSIETPAQLQAHFTAKPHAEPAAPSTAPRSNSTDRALVDMFVSSPLSIDAAEQRIACLT